MRLLHAIHVLSFVALFGASLALGVIGVAGEAFANAGAATSIAHGLVAPSALVSALTGGILAADHGGRIPGLGWHVAAASLAVFAAVIGMEAAVGYDPRVAEAASALAVYGFGVAMLTALAMAIAVRRRLRPNRRSD